MAAQNLEYPAGLSANYDAALDAAGPENVAA